MRIHLLQFAAFWLSGFSVVASTARAELRLLGDVNGNPVVVERMGAGRLVGRFEGRQVTIPLHAGFKLEGDLSCDFGVVHWPFHFFLMRPPTRDHLPRSERPHFGYVRLVNGTHWNGLVFDRIWPKGVGDSALAIFAWVVDGRVSRVHVSPLPSKSGRDVFRVDHLFQLTADEARGRPIVLVWSEGRFVAPRPLFKDEQLSRAASAVLLRDLTGLRVALDRGARLRGVSDDGRTLMELAAESGFAEIVDLLLTRGLSAEPYHSSAPIGMAVRNGRLDAVQRLLDAKVDPSRRFGDGTLLQQALRAGHEDVAQLLVERGANVEARAGIMENPLRQAIDGGYADLARLIWTKNPREPVAQADRHRVVWEQVKQGHTAMVQLLLEWRWDPNAIRNGRTSLWLAARTGNRLLTEALLQAGAKAECADGSGTSALMLAAAAGDAEMVRVLLASGASVATKRRDGNTALHFAAMHPSPKAVEMLAAAEANLNLPGANGLRPLDLALLSGSAETARWLSSHGARFEPKGAFAEWVVERAIALDLAPVLRDALEHGWPPDASVGGRSLLDLTRLVGATACEQLVRSDNAPVQAELAPWRALPALDRRPEAIKAVPAADMREPEHRHRAAFVELELDLTEHGDVFAARVQRSPHPRLAFAALQASRSWKFSPPVQNGTPVRTTLVQTFSFPPASDHVLEDALVDVPTQPITRWFANVLPWGPNSGEVIAQCVVTPQGTVENIQIVKAPDAEHARSAFHAIPNWSFTPGLRDGSTVSTSVEFVVPVNF
jgi:TonB family protein